MESVNEVVEELRPNALKRLYNWVLSWAESPYGTPALFLLAFAESSFFPIPPDVLLLALAISIPTRAFRYALVCTLGSALGGVAGYYIGVFLEAEVARPIIAFYGAEEKFHQVDELYKAHGPAALALAGFSPIPYKVFTIASGIFRMDILTFFVVSLLSRGARFVLVAGLIWKFGPQIKDFVDRYFNLLTIVFSVLLIGGFVVIKFVL